MSTDALKKRFPSLERTLPVARLGQFPSPLEEASDLALALDLPELWIKHDDRSGTLYGGNKVRKLELLLGRARRDHRGWIVTTGAWGSHHVLATTIFGRQLGLRVGAVLCPQPPTEHVLENLLCTAANGAAITPVPSAAAVTPALLFKAVRHRAMLIPPGGSTPLGALAFVGAALELAHQIKGRRLQPPERIYVALGSSGTMAGLLVGLLLAELPTKVIGVRVTDHYMANELIVAALANGTARLLRRLAPETPQLRFTRDEVTVIHDQFGDGYGHSTPEAVHAIELARDHAGLLLDGTYTGKAMAGLIADAAARPPRGPVVFWSTLNSVDLGKMIESASPEVLPRKLRSLFDRPQSPSRG